MENISIDKALTELREGGDTHTVKSLLDILKRVSGKVMASGALASDATFYFFGGGDAGWEDTYRRDR